MCTTNITTVPNNLLTTYRENADLFLYSVDCLNSCLYSLFTTFGTLNELRYQTGTCIRMESPGAVKSPGRENAQTQEITVKDCINKP